MGREKFLLRIPPQLMSRVKDIARSSGMSINEYICRSLEAVTYAEHESRKFENEFISEEHLKRCITTLHMVKNLGLTLVDYNIVEDKGVNKQSIIKCFTRTGLKLGSYIKVLLSEKSQLEQLKFFFDDILPCLSWPVKSIEVKEVNHKVHIKLFINKHASPRWIECMISVINGLAESLGFFFEDASGLGQELNIVLKKYRTVPLVIKPDSIVRIFEDSGFVAISPAIVSGKSGIKHRFYAAAFNAKASTPKLVLDISQSIYVTMEDIVSLFAKAYDVGVKNIILIAKGVTKDAKRLAKTYQINIVEAIEEENIITKIKKAVKQCLI